MNETIDNKIPTTIKGYCNSCEKQSEFVYIGKTSSGMPDLPMLLYNCECGTTKDYTAIYQATEQQYEQEELKEFIRK